MSDALADALDPRGARRNERAATLNYGIVKSVSPFVVTIDGTDVPDIPLVPGFDPQVGQRVALVGRGRTMVLWGEISTEIDYRHPRRISSGGVDEYVQIEEPPASAREGSWWIKVALGSDLIVVGKSLDVRWNVTTSGTTRAGKSLTVRYDVDWDPSAAIALPTTPAGALGVDTGPSSTVATLNTYEAWVGHDVIARTVYPVTLTSSTLTWAEVIAAWKAMLDPANTAGPAADANVMLVPRMPLLVPGQTFDQALAGANDLAWREMGAWARYYGQDRTIVGTGRPRLCPVMGPDQNGTSLLWSWGADAVAAAKCAAVVDRYIDQFYLGLNLSGTNYVPSPSSVGFATGYVPTLGGTTAIEASIPARTLWIDLTVKDASPTYAAGGNQSANWASVWTAINTGARGLGYFRDLALARSKLVGISTFQVGVNGTGWGGDNPGFITNLRTRLEGLIIDRLLLFANYAERDEAVVVHKLNPGTGLGTSAARFLLPGEFGGAPAAGPNAWFPTSFKEAMGFSSYTSSGSEFLDGEAWLGRQVQDTQMFYASPVQPTMANGEASWNSIVNTTHWTRSGGRQMTVVVSGPLGASSVSQPATNWLQNLTSSTADKTLLERMAKRITTMGLDTRFPDGRIKLIIRFAYELNVGGASGRFFPPQFWDDATADYLRTALSQRYGWMQAAMLSIGGHPENVGWAIGFSALGGGNATRNKRAIPTDGTVNLIDIDFYWDNWRFAGAGSSPQGGKTNAERRAQDAAVKAAAYDGACGLNPMLQVARDLDLPLTMTEVALQIKNNPQNGPNDSGGGVAPVFFPDLKAWMEAGPIAERRLMGWCQTFSNQAGGGTYICRITDARFAAIEPATHALMA